MGYARLYSLDSSGFKAGLIEVEVQLSRGLPSFQIVGLPEKSVRESRDRVRAAIINSSYTFPRQKVVVSLAPAERPKEGSYLDLPIALALLVASKQVVLLPRYSDWVWAGELSLAGRIRPPSNALGLVLGAQSLGCPLVLAKDVGMPRSLRKGAQVLGAQSLLEVAAVAEGKQESFVELKEIVETKESGSGVFLEDIQGRMVEKMALVIALAGGHSLLLEGAPGVGKTLLASAAEGMLPDLTDQEMVTVAKIYSMIGEQRISKRPPIRTPHHQISAVGLIGGGQTCRPGEISLAQHGVLFLDELTEYKRVLLDQLREPLQSGKVHIARAGYREVLPAASIFIAAMNPCPCGYYGVGDGCMCGFLEVKKYRACLSGPLLDRMSMHRKIQVEEGAVWREACKAGWADKLASTQSAQAVIKVARAQSSVRNTHQALADGGDRIQDADKAAITNWLEKNKGGNGLSWRGVDKVIRVARTIADCEQAVVVESRHLTMAKHLRQQAAGIMG
jgi:magnesium chelatase family protein